MFDEGAVPRSGCNSPQDQEGFLKGVVMNDLDVWAILLHGYERLRLNRRMNILCSCFH